MADAAFTPSGPAIRSLRIEYFRGIESLEWRPAAGLNLIVGPGDSCKSTVLEAISLLFSPAPNVGITEFDYFNRVTATGFLIEAVLAIGDESVLKGDKFPLPPVQGWLNNQLVDLPDENGAEPVLRCRLTGNPELETTYEVVAADEETRTPFSRALRQRIGTMRLGIGDRGDRDLRLVYGGALDRFMQGQELRQSLLQAVLKTPIHDQLGDDPKKALGQVEEQFKKKSLPHPLRLGLVGTPGVSLAASVGLTVGTDDQSALPLTAWGTGTRRLASLELAALVVDQKSIAIVDEPEAGLEPYRQRVFIQDLNDGANRQSFVSTHAPAVLSAAAEQDAVTWRINETSAPTVKDEKEPVAAAEPSHLMQPLRGKEITIFISSQPETILSRLPVICEGVTEQGFATRILQEKFGRPFAARGLFCADAGGHDKALPICKQLIDAGITLAAVVDDEGHKSGTWDAVGKRAILLRWDDGASLEIAVLSSLPNELLLKVIDWAEEATGREAKHYLAELRQALGVEDKIKSADQLLADVGRQAFLKALLLAACPPKGVKKPKGWFKSFDGGYVLADRILAVQPRPALLAKVDAFLAAIETATAP